MKNETKKGKKDGSSQKPPIKAIQIGVDVESARTRSIIVIAITCVGIVILFSSWISQNYFKSRWLNEKLYLEKTQLLIDIEVANAKQWELLFNIEAKATSPNEVRHLLSAYNYVKSITTILAWEEARVSDDEYRETPIIVKNLMHAKAKELLKKNDIKGLTELVVLAGEAQNKFINDLDEKYFAKLANANYRGMLWDKLFLVFYIIGSLLIGVRWFLVNVLSWPSTYVKKPECAPSVLPRSQ